ncbi:MAG: TolC family protein [Mariniphaga sp.]|nr:TolC family protein [Mariniphaga sp.]
MKLLIKVLPGLFLMIFTFTSIAQETWSLQKCIDYALDNNIQIKQQELNSDYQGNLVNQAKSNRLPNLNAQFGNNFNFGRSLQYDNTYENVNSMSLSGGMGANATLYNGFVLKNTIEQRELDLQASYQDLQKAKDDIMLSIAASYLEILFAEELILVTEAQMEVTQQQINRTQQLVDAGSLAKGSLLEIEAQLAQEELQFVNDQNRVQLAYLNLYQFLELPISESFVIEKPDLPEIGSAIATMNSIDVFNNALNLRPEIKAALLRVESMKTQLDIAKGAQYPDLSFGANYYNNYNDNYQSYNQITGETSVIPFADQIKNNERYGFGFTLNIPIFNRHQVKNNISNSKLQVIDYEYRLQTSKNLLRKDIEQAYTNALAALNRYISSEKAVSSMQEAFRYIEEKFNVGMVNSVEFNQSKNNLSRAQSDLLQSKYEYIFRTKILDFYNGVKIEL